MDIGRPTTMTEALLLINMVQYYKYMGSRKSHTLYTLTEASERPRGRKYFGITR